MAQAQGWKGTLGIQEETTYGADPAAPDLAKIWFETESISASRNLVSSNTISGTRNPSPPVLGNIDVGGDISCELQAYVARPIKGVMGSVTTVGASSPYTHTFKVGSSLPSFVIERAVPDLSQFFKYNGVKFGGLSINLTPEGFQKLSFKVTGQKETPGAVSFDATMTDLGNSSFDGFSGTLSEGTFGGALTAMATITKMDISIENNLDTGVYCIGGAGTRAALPEGTVKVSGTVEVLFDSMALLEKAIAGTTSVLKAAYTRGTGLGTAGNESIEFLIPELKFSQKTPTISGSKGMMLSLSFEGFYSAGTELTALQVVLKSSQAIV